MSEANDLQRSNATVGSLELAGHLLQMFGKKHESGFLQVPKTVREIALATGRSPGTIQSHLRRLDGLGVRVDAQRRLFDPTQLATLTQPSSEDVKETSPSTDHGGISDRHESSVRAFAALLELVEAAPSELETATQVAARLLADTARASARPRDDLRDASRNKDLDDKTKQPITTDLLIDQSIGELEERATRERTREAAQTHKRDREDLVRLLAPLAAVCDSLGLPGITNSTGLNRRLAPYADEQIRFAMRKLIVEARSGACSRPIGKLANISAEGSEDYFPAEAPNVNLPGDPAPQIDLIVGEPRESEPNKANEEVVRASLGEARKALGR